MSITQEFVQIRALMQDRKHERSHGTASYGARRLELVSASPCGAHRQCCGCAARAGFRDMSFCRTVARNAYAWLWQNRYVPTNFGHFPPPLGAAQDGGHLAMVIRPSSINTISRPLKSLSLPYPMAIEQPERQRCLSVSLA